MHTPDWKGARRQSPDRGKPHPVVAVVERPVLERCPVAVQRCSQVPADTPLEQGRPDSAEADMPVPVVQAAA